MRRVCGRDGVRAAHFGSRPRDSKRVGKFATDAGTRHEVLDMYPRERRKPTDAVKSPDRFERNARRMA